jgi:thioester reductase-like protein
VPVALTGATGFLGLHLVRGRLTERGALLVPARGAPEAALARIGRFLALAASPTWPRNLRARVRVVHADVTQPRCGLTAARRARRRGGRAPAPRG